MKSLTLVLGVVVAMLFIAGCAKKPVAFSPKTQAETAIMAYCKQKMPQFVVVDIKAVPMPNMPGRPQIDMPKDMPMPYAVRLSSPTDDKKTAGTSVMYNEKDQKVIEPPSGPMIPPMPK